MWQLFYSDGLLFSGSFDHTIKVWDLETFGCIKSLTGHKGYVHSLIGCGSEKYANTNNSSTNGQYFILSGSGDKIIKLWKG